MQINRVSLGSMVVVGILWGQGFAIAACQTTLVDEGQAKCAIYVTARVMAEDQILIGQPAAAQQSESSRQRLRESVKDLSHYLEKMSGAKVGMIPGEPVAESSTIPILVGELAVSKFGPPQPQPVSGQGFRFVVTPTAIGLAGESDLGTSYAIYELLDRLGCRWFMPSELGESIPELKTIRLATTDESLAPYTIYRDIWHSDPVYSRRNRAGGLGISAGHALEGYVTKDQLEQHPDWNAEIGGERRLHPCDVGHRLCWANPEVADAIGDSIIAILDRDGGRSMSLSPGDGTNFCECAKCRALDSGDWDATMNCISITDRYLHLANRIAERVAAKHPDVMLGFLAYVQFTRPPLREKVHPNLYPQVAPISYSRAHPMTDDQVPGNKDLRHLVEGWGKCKPDVSYYLYSWFLAESCAPNPLIHKWSTDLPILYRNNCKFWQPEGITNFETSLQGIYLGLRLAWNPNQDPKQIIDELHDRFYGNASPQMAAYWKFVDQIWVGTPEYSGCCWGYLARFTPERLGEMRQLLDVAKSAAKSDVERARIQIADESLTLFERYMKMRYDLAEGRFSSLPADMKTYADRATALADQYAPQKCFGKMYWIHSLTSDFYFNVFCRATYTDAARIADSNQFVLLAPKPVREFKYQVDFERQGEGLGWMKPEFDDQTWQGTDTCLQTWSSLGLHDYMGMLWYRTTIELPPTTLEENAPSSQVKLDAVRTSSKSPRVYLWLAATDGSAKLFVNGKHIPYVKVVKDAEGQETRTVENEFVGYAQPASFDITDAIVSGRNCIAIQCVRLSQNELGSGGLLGPVLVYREK